MKKVPTQIGDFKINQDKLTADFLTSIRGNIGMPYSDDFDMDSVCASLAGCAVNAVINQIKNDTRFQGNLIQNAVYCSDTNTYYKSGHVHDYVSFTSGGQNCFIDGGLDYVRCSVMPPTVVNYCVYDTDSDNVKKERLLWGTYGKDGKGPLKQVPLIKLETDHIEAILETQKNIPPHYRRLLESILSDRRGQ